MSTLNKGGRPQKEETRKQKHRLVCYLNLQESNEYQLFLSNNPGSNSYHLKNALLSYIGSSVKQPQKINKNVTAAFNELNAVSRLENQIAKHLNRGLKLDGSSTIQHMKNQQEIKRIINQIKDLLIQ